MELKVFEEAKKLQEAINEIDSLRTGLSSVKSVESLGMQIVFNSFSEPLVYNIPNSLAHKLCDKIDDFLSIREGLLKKYFNDL